MNTQETGHRDISFEGIKFRDTPFLESGLADIIDYLLSRNYNVIFSGENFHIHHIRLSDFLAIFPSEEERKAYKESLLGVSSEDVGDNQRPKLRGEFNYKDEYYLILGTERPFQDFDDINDLYYKNILFSPLNLLKSITGVKKGVISDTDDILKSEDLN